jgi:hypothetical protein
MRATRLLSATSSGVGMNVRWVGYGLAVSGYPRIYRWTAMLEALQTRKIASMVAARRFKMLLQKAAAASISST